MAKRAVKRKSKKRKPKPQKKPKPSPQEWLNVKNDIKRLYIVECKNLTDVARVLKDDLGFIATLRMYKSRLKEWNFNQKTIRQADWRFMFQEYIRRQKLRPPKETVFRIRKGSVTKLKTIEHIKAYMRRIQVSKDEFLSSTSDSAYFSHIKFNTPPLSPALSSASASPPGEMDGYQANAATPASLMDTTTTVSDGMNGSPSQRLNIDVSRHVSSSQVVGCPSDYYRDNTTTPPDSFTSSQGRRNPTYFCFSPESLEILLSGSRRMAIRTFALDQQNPCEDVCLYHSVAGPPSLTYTEVSNTHDDFSALARTLSDSEEEVSEDETRAFRWASRYFLACILQGRKQFLLAEAATASAARIFERMLMSETRIPCQFPRQNYVPSHPSRFILSGLDLMTTVLKAHGRDDMVKRFLLDSHHSIEKFFRMENHPLSAPYAYLLALMDNDDIDDEAWEMTLRDAHTKIHHIWDGGPNAVVSYYYWACHILKRKRYEDAIEILKICYNNASEMYGECHIITVNSISKIAKALSDQGMYSDAVPWLVDALKRAQWALGVDHPFCYTLMEQLGNIYRKLGILTTAEETFQRVVEGRKKSLGVDHPHTLLAMDKLTGCRMDRARRPRYDLTTHLSILR